MWHWLPTEETSLCRQMTAVLADAPLWRPRPLPSGYEPDGMRLDCQMLNMISVKLEAETEPDATDQDKVQIFDELYDRGTGVALTQHTM